MDRFDILNIIMNFLYSAAHYTGQLAIYALSAVLPETIDISTLADPLGFLVLLTIFVVITTTVKKVAFIIVIVGWVLILLRMGLMIAGI